jgi:hypothetical protein
MYRSSGYSTWEVSCGYNVDCDAKEVLLQSRLIEVAFTQLLLIAALFSPNFVQNPEA